MNDEKIIEKLEILEKKMEESNQINNSIHVLLMIITGFLIFFFIAFIYFLYNYATWWRLS
ncbi:MAG: hypothetical protein ACFE85_09625 [Candidatus Hodarchaeota archaeon]